jgi:prepilin peptidase dependent protein B
MQLKSKGFTLMELLIAMSIGMVIIAGTLAVFLAMVKQSRGLLEASRLDRDLTNAMSIMVTDIQRAGYWANASTSSTNPYMTTGSTDIAVTGGNCILFTYDASGNGSLPAIGTGTDDERYGYRLSGGAIQFRPVNATNYVCSAGAGTWTNLTDPNVETITALSFVLTSTPITIGAGPHTINLRQVAITLTGQLVSDTALSKTITRTVRVYNDKYVP